MAATSQRIHDLAERIAARRFDQTSPNEWADRIDQLTAILELTGLTAVQEAELHLLAEAYDARRDAWYAADCPPIERTS